MLEFGWIFREIVIKSWIGSDANSIVNWFFLNKIWDECCVVFWMSEKLKQMSKRWKEVETKKGDEINDRVKRHA